MDDLYMNCYEVKKDDYTGIYVFLTATEHPQADTVISGNKDCLCWIIFPERLQFFLLLYPNTDDLFELEVNRFKVEAI